MSFDQLGLRAELLGAIAAQGYTQPTPIQAQAIPVVLEGRDVLAGAQTGTGKTAGFTLPLLQLLSNKGARVKGARPKALILTPTRELAAQVGESVEVYGKNLPLRSQVIFGGVSINPQISKLRSGVDILVATPGRLLDHAGQRTVDLSGIEILILDEADRMLDMGFIHDIRRLLKLLPAKRQNLMFSATYSDEIKRLADGILVNPAEIEVARRNTAAESVSQLVYPVAQKQKRTLLSQLIGEGDWHQVLVFTRTKHGANRLVKQLETDGISAAAIHGNKSQGARTKALADFKSGQVRTLVATDIAARGIDIDKLPHVVNYELPNVAEDYVHRIGRTGRAGAEGQAISLVSADENKLLKGIERLLKRKIPSEVAEGFRQETAAEMAEKPASTERGQRQGQRQGQGRGQGQGQNKPKGQGQNKSRGQRGEQRRSEAGTSTGDQDNRAKRRRRPSQRSGNGAGQRQA